MRWPWQPATEGVAGSVVVPGDRSSETSVELGSSARMPEEWQDRAWKFWAELPEINFPTSYLARQVSRVRWEVVDATGEPADEARSAEVMAEVTDGIGEEEAARQIALNLYVAGDGNYIKRGERFDFEVLSVVAEKRAEILKGSAFNLRFYNPDPRSTRKATSSVRPALGAAEELQTLEALSRAQSRSRIAQAGIFLYPVEQEFEDGDPFETDLERAMTLAIKDVNHPAALAPITVAMDSELIEKVRHIIFERPYDEHIDQKINLATRRVAIALDMPIELLMGIGDLNHWSAWLISEEIYSAHVGPMAIQVGEVFAETWDKLHPEEPIAAIMPDPAELLARKSSVRDAMDAVKLGAVSYEYLRDIMGADEDDAPTPEDLEVLISVTRPSREGNVEENPGPPEAIAAASSETRVDLDELSKELAKIDVQLRDRFIGATEATGIRAMEKIGARARTAARTDPVLREKLADLRLEEIGPALGSQQLVAIGVDLDKIVDESVDALVAHWERTLPDAWFKIADLGIHTNVDTEGPTERSSEVLRAGVAKWIIGNLDRDEPAAAPTDVVRLAVATAGGQ